MTVFGATSDGAEVYEIEIGKGDTTATILTLGARLHAFTDGRCPNVCVGSVDVAGYEDTHIYSGPIVGPVVNRLANASAPLDGKILSFPANQEEHTLHSGGPGCHGANWTIDEKTDDSVSLVCALPDGRDGFPGNRSFRATWTISAPNGIVLELSAVTDAPTFMNLAHHGVWNLEGGETWEGHSLMVPAERYTPTGPGKIPTGEVSPVAGTPYDHRTARAPDPSLDHNYCFATDGAMRLQAVLSGPTGRRLEVHSTAPGLQVYAGGPKGIALEPQMWPDAPHHLHFPSITLRPGESFKQRCLFHLYPPAS